MFVDHIVRAISCVVEVVRCAGGRRGFARAESWVGSDLDVEEMQFSVVGFYFLMFSMSPSPVGASTAAAATVGSPTVGACSVDIGKNLADGISTPRSRTPSP